MLLGDSFESSGSDSRSVLREAVRWRRVGEEDGLVRAEVLAEEGVCRRGGEKSG